MARPHLNAERPATTLRRILALTLPVVLAVSALAGSAARAEAATVSGQLRYSDTGGMVAIKSASVEIRWTRGGFFDGWSTLATVKTNQFGKYTFTDFTSSGVFAVLVYATNDAAKVWPVDVYIEPFHVDAGAPTRQAPMSATSVLDFSSDFTDPLVARFFNVAETLRIGLEYATARRAPGETDGISQVSVNPTSWSLTQTTYYNPTTNTITIQQAAMTSDWSALHEYGHHLESQISTLGFEVAPWHDGCRAMLWQGGPLTNTAEQAWVEGFASYFADAVGRMRVADNAIPDGAQFGALNETPAPCSAIGQNSVTEYITPKMIENIVRDSLWDLLDPVGSPEQGVEAHDLIGGEDTAIFQIFDRDLDTGLAPTILTFRAAWIAQGKNIVALDCILGNLNIVATRPECRQSTAVKLAGDFDHDGKTDIALTGAQGWGSIPVAFSNGDGSFRVTNSAVTDFPTWAANPRASKLTGDFDGDGRTDIALCGGIGWGSIPVALSTGNGQFTVFNNAVGEDFAGLAANPEARKITGDFNGDGKTDIALVGVPGWQSIPIAFSTSQGNFVVRNLPASLNFTIAASTQTATVLAGFFNNDRKTDLMVAGTAAIVIPIALSNGDGSFNSSALQSLDFAIWARDSRARKLIGDFNGDGVTDIALTGPAEWSSVPVALSNSAGGFDIANAYIGDFASWSAASGTVALVGDFNGGGWSDIALTAGPGWNTVPVAVSLVWNFAVSNVPVGDFGAWSTTPGAKPLIGDFNGDGKSDIALTGPAGWGSVPVAFSNGFTSVSIVIPGRLRPPAPSSLTFTVTNSGIVDFAGWASAP